MTTEFKVDQKYKLKLIDGNVYRSHVVFKMSQLKDDKRGHPMHKWSQTDEYRWIVDNSPIPIEIETFKEHRTFSIQYFAYAYLTDAQMSFYTLKFK